MILSIPVFLGTYFGVGGFGWNASVYSFTSASSGFTLPCSVKKYVRSTSILAGGPGLKSYGLVVFLDFLNSISYDLIISISQAVAFALFRTQTISHSDDSSSHNP